MATLATALVTLTAAAPGAQARKKPDPQQHEVGASLDVLPSNVWTQSTLDLQYTWTPAFLDRNDEVVPALRRFVRQPDSLWARIHYDSITLESHTALHGGGILSLLDRRLFASGEVGLRWDALDRNFENDYLSIPVSVELGGRPFPILSFGITGRIRPAIYTIQSDTGATIPASRRGNEKEAGITITVATPGDRFYATLSACYRLTNWDYYGFHPGEIEATGPNADLLLSLQVSPTTSWQLQLAGRHEHWDNRRGGDQGSDYVGPQTTIDADAISASFGLLFWSRGRWGLRAALAGGYERIPPIFYARDVQVPRHRGFVGLRLGLVSRY
ncbi:MAG: hypothetical protein V2A73_23190 [Pseudomonadota bacterium]